MSSEPRGADVRPPPEDPDLDAGPDEPLLTAVDEAIAALKSEAADLHVAAETFRRDRALAGYRRAEGRRT